MKKPNSTKKIRIRRPMFIDGQYTAAGSVVTVSHETARDLVAGERADLVPEGKAEAAKSE